MKFFGEKSVSSFMYKLSRVGYYLSILAMICGIIDTLLGLLDKSEKYLIESITSGMFSISLDKAIPDKFFGMYALSIGAFGFFSSKYATKLFDNFRINTVFDRENVKYIKLLAIIEFIGCFFIDVKEYIDFRNAVEYIKIKEVDINYFFFENTFDSVFLVITYLMIAIALEKAIEYKEENELTV